MKEFKELNNTLRKDNDSLKIVELKKNKVERESQTKMKELEKMVAKLQANKDRLRIEHRAELDNLFGQVNSMMEKMETIAGDAVVKTKAKIMQQYKDWRVNQWWPDEAIAAWEELKALAAAEEADVKAAVGSGGLVPSPAEDA
ncbi:hypothetical protein ACOSQ3_004531 [Xanthoceras sorbifolium]